MIPEGEQRKRRVNVWEHQVIFFGSFLRIRQSTTHYFTYLRAQAAAGYLGSTEGRVGSKTTLPNQTKISGVSRTII